MGLKAKRAKRKIKMESCIIDNELVKKDDVKYVSHETNHDTKNVKRSIKDVLN